MRAGPVSRRDPTRGRRVRHSRPRALPAPSRRAGPRDPHPCRAQCRAVAAPPRFPRRCASASTAAPASSSRAAMRCGDRVGRGPSIRAPFATIRSCNIGSVK
ncbi:hypothetical protein SEVIR_1G140402v4 [Setaria viridis]